MHDHIWTFDQPNTQYIRAQCILCRCTTFLPAGTPSLGWVSQLDQKITAPCRRAKRGAILEPRLAPLDARLKSAPAHEITIRVN